MGERNESEALRRELEEFQAAQKKNVDDSAKELEGTYSEGKKNAEHLGDAKKTVKQYKDAVAAAEKANLPVADLVRGGLDKAQRLQEGFEGAEQKLMTKAKSKMTEPGVSGKLYGDAKSEMNTAEAGKTETKTLEQIKLTASKLAARIEALIPTYEKAIAELDRKLTLRNQKTQDSQNMKSPHNAFKEVDPEVKKVYDQYQNSRVPFKEFKYKLEQLRSDLGVFSGKKKAAYNTIIEYAQAIEDARIAEKDFQDSYNTIRSPKWEGFKQIEGEIKNEQEKLKQEEAKITKMAGIPTTQHRFSSELVYEIEKQLTKNTGGRTMRDQSTFHYNLHELLNSIRYK